MESLLQIPVLTFKLLVVSFITAQRQLIHERTASRVTWNQSYDFIVVGAGTAGCTVANRLTEDTNVKLLLLEAGGPQSAIYNDIPAMVDFVIRDRTDLQWNYYNEPQENAGKQYPNGQIPEPRAKTIGGSSSHNQMLYNRGNRWDFDNWEQRFGAIGWSYKDVLPLFKRSENNTDLIIVAQNREYHSTRGPIQITSSRKTPKIFELLIKVYSDFGFKYTDFNGPNQFGSTIPQHWINTLGFRSSNSNAFVDPNPHPNNLHIVAKALVIRILFKQLKAIGVEFDRLGQKFRVYANKEVIISGGAINSPQLLMLSGVGPRSHLQNLGIPVIADLPVGDHYSNHPNIKVNAQIMDPSLFYPAVVLNTEALSELYFSKDGRLSESPYAGLYYFSSIRAERSRPNALLYSYIAPNGTVLQFFLNFVVPRSYGTIRLQSSSPYVQPKIDPNFFGDPQDFRETVESTRFIFYLLENSSIAPYLRIPSFEASGCPPCNRRFKYQCTESIECYIRYNTDTTYHPSGGCRMGSVNRDDVVVDPNLKVKNIDNLRVCDASIFPQIPNGNTNAPTTMVGEKCAQIIKDCYHLK